METYNVQITGKRDFVFTGDEIASDTTETGTGTKQVIRVYKTEKGLFVVSKDYLTQWANDKDKYDAIATRENEDIFGFLGFSDAAKNVYYQLGIDSTLHLK